MAASRVDIDCWYDAGVTDGSTHMIVVCDEFDWSDYPVYVTGDADEVRAARQKLDAESMQRVMEVYILKAERKDEQVNTPSRVFNYS